MDPITLQILWDRLLAIVEEQAQVLMRTAFSTTVREAGDLSAGIFDPNGAMLAQAITGTPGHVNAMASSVVEFLKAFPLDQLNSGDVLLTNDPWHGTGHLNDFTVVTPVFLGDHVVALIAATSHIADVGGLGFGPEGRQVFEEGLNIPMSRLYQGGELNETLIQILRANVRDPGSAVGDLHSLTACNHSAAESLLTTLKEFDLTTLDPVAELIIGRSSAAMEAEIRALPESSWHNTMTIDGYDEPVVLSCTTTIVDGKILVDFAGSSAASSRGINVPLTYTQAYASFGVRCVVGNDIPNNAGSLSRVVVSAPEGSILNAPRPCAVSARHAIGQMLPDVVLGCLDYPLGGQVPSEGASCLFGPVFLGGKGVVADSQSQPFVMNAFYTGGSGARPAQDGLSCTAFPSGVRSTPVEITESASPLLITRKEFRPNSGGNGQYRGGLGQRMEFTHVHGEGFVVSRMFDRIHHPARGRNGGGDGAAARCAVAGQSDLPGMGRNEVPAGGTFVLETAGGAGRGDPECRSSAAIQQDLLLGLTTARKTADND
ncbi:MAG: hydantoinase B/oxoprolinase family protein [Lysobacterales bacterium]